MMMMMTFFIIYSNNDNVIYSNNDDDDNCIMYFTWNQICNRHMTVSKLNSTVKLRDGYLSKLWFSAFVDSGYGFNIQKE